MPSIVFQKKYRERYGREITPGVGHSYDSVLLLAEAARVSKEQGLHITQALLGISKHDGVVGTVTVRSDGVILSDPSVQVIRDGKPSTILPE